MANLGHARRNLRFLESRGLLQRTHGGAIAVASKGIYPADTYNPKELTEIRKEYLTVAKKAIEHIGTQEIIYLTTSSTGYYRAINLPDDLLITVLTNSDEKVSEDFLVQIDEIGGKSMYCILVTGIPAAGKTTLADNLAEYFKLPILSKDKMKEIMYDEVGFQSRAGKVKLGLCSMKLMYYMAEQLMKINQPFILENNFENNSKKDLFEILEKYSYKAITITLTGNYERIYQRFLARNASGNRHRGHIVNDCYPEKEKKGINSQISYESFVQGITSRGMDCFVANGPQIIVDTTDFDKINKEALLQQIKAYRMEILDE